MKKISLFLTALLAASSALAANNQAAPQQENAKTEFMFGAKAANDPVGIWQKDGRHFSKKDLSKQFCWTLTNFRSDSGNVNINITLTSPKNTNFSLGEHISKNTTTHIFNFTYPITQTYYNCWAFEESDPEGKYTLTVKANNTTFPTQVFTLTK